MAPPDGQVMSKSKPNPEFVKLRRKDRAVEDEVWIADFLDIAPFCVLATAVDNMPVANANTFVYNRDLRMVYLHTAKTGTLRKNIESNPNVCFVAFEMGRLLPAEVAKELSVEYRSVVAYGKAKIVEDEDECRHALESLARKYFSHMTAGKDYRTLTSQEAIQTTVYRIEIERWSGKTKQESSDFPGAFDYTPQRKVDASGHGD